MERIQDFILVQDPQTVNAKVVSNVAKAKPQVTFETVFASGADFAVRKKTARTSMVMVVLVSQDQFYIKEETAGGIIKNIDESSLTKFINGLPEGGYKISDENGNPPYWISEIKKTADWRKIFLMVLNDQRLHPYMKGDMFDINIFMDSPYRNYDPPQADFNAVKSVFEIAEKYLGKAEAKRQIFDYGEGVFRDIFRTSNYGYRRNDVESAYDQIYSKWGIEGIRQFVTMFFETPVVQFPNGYTFSRIFNRYVPSQMRQYPYNDNVLAETVFDLQQIVNYIFCQCAKQGFPESPTSFWTSWCDYMDQQVALYGEVRDKYSEHLASDEHITAYRCTKLKSLISEENFKKAADYLSAYEYTDGEYCIVAPKKPDDLIEEGRQLSHCVGGYVDAVGNLDKYVFFMRRSQEPDKPLVTIEVLTDGTLYQVHGRFNCEPAHEHMQFVKKWHKKYFIDNAANN